MVIIVVNGILIELSSLNLYQVFKLLFFKMLLFVYILIELS